MARNKGPVRYEPPEGWFVVAELGPAHGLKGEVTARLTGVTGEELAGIGELRMRRADGEEAPVTVSRTRPKKGFWILAIERIQDRSGAEACRNGVLVAPRDALPPPDPDEWWVADLVGLRVETEAGETLGVLEEVLALPANDVYVVRGERGEILLPVTDEVVRDVRPEEGRIVVRLIPGLLDAPGPEAPEPKEGGGGG